MNHRAFGLALALALAITVPARGEDALSCIVKPRQTVELGAQVAGVIDEVLVSRGDRVARGQVVARLRREVEQVNVALNEARAASTAEIERRKLELANKRNVLARKRQLSQRDFASKADLETAQVEAQVAAQLLREARDSRELAEIELARARAMVDLRILRSPVDGIVTESHLAPGEFVSEQKPVMTLTDVDPLHVEVYLPLARFGAVELGQEVPVVLQAPIGGEYIANVIVVDSVIDAASETFGVRLELPNPEGRIPAGLRCDVSFSS
jgi:RND family efflux transporter MFP subunit